jgi:hypothetical protein
MQPLQRVAPAVVAMVFALLAFIFSLLAITSPQWGARNQYPNNTDSISETTPIYTLYRSPFQICGAVAIVVNSTTPPTPSNATSDPGGDEPPPPQLNYTYKTTCQHYRAFGFDKTSCELASATKSKTVPQVGDRRLCDQIHYAGNFSITSTVFISLAFLLTLAMGVVGFVVANNGSSSGDTTSATTTAPTTTTSGRVVNATDDDDDDDQEDQVGKDAGPKSGGRHHQVRDVEDGIRPTNHNHPSSTNNPNNPNPPTVPTNPPIYSALYRPLFSASPYLTLLILTFSFIGVAAALISQFYAILAFTESSPNNADFATSQGNHEKHDPWVQGKALSVYLTLSWAFAAAAGFATHLLWRGSTWERL